MNNSFDQSPPIAALPLAGQYQELTRQLTALADVMDDGEAPLDVTKICNFLAQYVIQQLSAAEPPAEATSSADKQAHARFVASLTELQKRFDDVDVGPAKLPEMQRTVYDWALKLIGSLDTDIKR